MTQARHSTTHEGVWGRASSCSYQQLSAISSCQLLLHPSRLESLDAPEVTTLASLASDWFILALLASDLLRLSLLLFDWATLASLLFDWATLAALLFDFLPTLSLLFFDLLTLASL